MTHATKLVMAALMREPTSEQYGLDLARMTRLRSGTLYPILARLEAVGWLTSRWEDVDESAVGRPRRRYYRLAVPGVAVGHRIVEAIPGEAPVWELA